MKKRDNKDIEIKNLVNDLHALKIISIKWDKKIEKLSPEN